MKYDQVDHALTFLTKPGDYITLQVPWRQDFDLVRQHVIERMGKPLNGSNPDKMVYPGMRIFLETVACSRVGFFDGPAFLIDRDHDDSWIERLGIVE